MKNEPTTESPKRVFSNPLLVVALTLVIFIISQLIAFVIVQAGHSALGAKSSIDQSAITQFGYILIAEILTIGAVLGLLRRAKLSLKTIGWGRGPSLKDLKWAVVGTLVFYGLLIATTVLLSALIPSFDANQPQDVGFKGLMTTPDKVIAFFALVILPPLGEETLIRGYLYSSLRARWRYLPAMLLTSLLFGAAHLTTGDSGILWAAGATTFVLSVVLVYLREKTGALYAPVLVHIANNFLAFFIYIHG
ncbi:CPBP family intramembrane metalloprotease [Candidatus Saccharibacteria bacterium]|nr:CPBP family intramembrane metalloprotease [Candidatus Saccharibacteria bacterium]